MPPTNPNNSLAGGLFGSFYGMVGDTTAPQIDMSQVNQALGGTNAQGNMNAQNQATQMALQAAQGKGPSAAQAMLNAQGKQMFAQNAAMAANQRGNAGNAAKTAEAANAGGQAQLGGQAAIARAQEQLGGMGLAGQLAGQGRAQDIGTAGLYGGLAANQAGLTAQNNALEAQIQQANVGNAKNNMQGVMQTAATIGELGMMSDPRSKLDAAPAEADANRDGDFSAAVRQRHAGLYKLPAMGGNISNDTQATAFSSPPDAKMGASGADGEGGFSSAMSMLGGGGDSGPSQQVGSGLPDVKPYQPQGISSPRQNKDNILDAGSFDISAPPSSFAGRGPQANPGGVTPFGGGVDYRQRAPMDMAPATAAAPYGSDLSPTVSGSLDYQGPGRDPQEFSGPASVPQVPVSPMPQQRMAPGVDPSEVMSRPPSGPTDDYQVVGGPYDKKATEAANEGRPEEGDKKKDSALSRIMARSKKDAKGSDAGQSVGEDLPDVTPFYYRPEDYSFSSPPDAKQGVRQVEGSQSSEDDPEAKDRTPEKPELEDYRGAFSLGEPNPDSWMKFYDPSNPTPKFDPGESNLSRGGDYADLSYDSGGYDFPIAQSEGKFSERPSGTNLQYPWVSNVWGRRAPSDSFASYKAPGMESRSQQVQPKMQDRSAPVSLPKGAVPVQRNVGTTDRTQMLSSPPEAKDEIAEEVQGPWMQGLKAGVQAGTLGLVEGRTQSYKDPEGEDMASPGVGTPTARSGAYREAKPTMRQAVGPGQAQPMRGPGGQPAFFADRAQKNRQQLSSPPEAKQETDRASIDDALRTMKAYSFSYKDDANQQTPGKPPGSRYFGVMTTDVKKNPVAKNMVMGPPGSMEKISVPAATSFNLASAAHLQKQLDRQSIRLSAIEKMFGSGARKTLRRKVAGRMM